MPVNLVIGDILFFSVVICILMTIVIIEKEEGGGGCVRGTRKKKIEEVPEVEKKSTHGAAQTEHIQKVNN